MGYARDRDIKLLPTEVGDAVTDIILGSEDDEMPDKVDGYEIDFRGSEMPELTRLLEAKFGAAHKGNEGEHIYRDSLHVEIHGYTLAVGFIDRR